MKRAFLSVRDQMMAKLVAEETAKAIGAMLDERDARTAPVPVGWERPASREWTPTDPIG